MSYDKKNISPEKRLFQSIVEETVDDIYVIDKENYNLLYTNELKNGFLKEESRIGKKCYHILYGKSEPCEFCTLKKRDVFDIHQEVTYEDNGHFFAARFREMDWNGIPACVKFVRDITDEVESRKQKERLEQYFQMVVKYLPGGMAVVHHEVGGALRPEYLSDGFAEMMDMSNEEAWEMYEQNALGGVHPDDREYVRQNLDKCGSSAFLRTSIIPIHQLCR